jgi:transcriptional regulator with XRE-family HTH domain
VTASAAWSGARLRKLRERSGRSIRALARDSGVAASIISRAERGVSTPSMATVAALAKTLGCGASRLMGERSER